MMPLDLTDEEAASLLRFRRAVITRRIEPQPGEPGFQMPLGGEAWMHLACPFGAAGGEVWGREAWAVVGWRDPIEETIVQYRAPSLKGESWPMVGSWSPPDEMPRWATRFPMLRIEAVEAKQEPDGWAWLVTLAGAASRSDD